MCPEPATMLIVEDETNAGAKPRSAYKALRCCAHEDFFSLFLVGSKAATLPEEMLLMLSQLRVMYWHFGWIKQHVNNSCKGSH